MLFKNLLPDYYFAAVTDISVEFLRSIGVRLLLCDLDNTLAVYSGEPPNEEVIRWKQALTDGGITLFIVSNTRTERAENYAAKLGVGYIKQALKPLRRNIIRAAALCGVPPMETALVGDQVFTDTLGANRSGIRSILTEPILLRKPFHKLRYIIERPIRRTVH
ncbi:MAG: YqeG family HAD IIIA-type phosphatase [Oscillospiraceae bacterium]|jgi:HAD superfamily phosphatase (TIGR01668 family)|nr:YqeG family HAD IIIA-type phosphatase [Oscillospiraceae bacterium]